MRKFWSGVLAAGLVATVGVSAQNAPGAQSPETQKPGTQTPGTQTPGTQGAGAQTPGGQGAGAQSQASGKTVTLTGCIQNAPAAGGAAASASTGGFILAMKPQTGAQAGAVGTAGTTGTRYRLEGNSAELSKHLNQQVQITGMLDGASAAGAGRAGAGSTAGSSAGGANTGASAGASNTGAANTGSSTGATSKPQQGSSTAGAGASTGAGAAAMGPTLKVESVKMISATCS